MDDVAQHVDLARAGRSISDAASDTMGIVWGPKQSLNSEVDSGG